MGIKHFFSTQEVESSDGVNFYELVTQNGERVASAANENLLEDLEMALNMALTDASEANPDVVITSSIWDE